MAQTGIEEDLTLSGVFLRLLSEMPPQDSNLNPAYSSGASVDQINLNLIIGTKTHFRPRYQAVAI